MGATFDSFGEWFSYLVRETGYTPGQIASRSGVPKMTVVNWLNGRVKRPRSWESLLKVARAMRLQKEEVETLLACAGHPSLYDLSQAEPLSITLFATWLDQDSRLTPFLVGPRLPYFTGRAELITQIKQQLTDQPSRPIVLHGMAGSGKTTLAAEIAYLLREKFADGVFWAALSGQHPMAILRHFAYLLNQSLDPRADPAMVRHAYRTALSRKQVLLILDNVEAAHSIRSLLPPTGRSSLIVTSRRPAVLTLEGAIPIRVPSLSIHKPEIIPIFEWFLGKKIPHAAQTTLLELAEKLGGHPLALAVAAGRMALEPHWTAAEFLDQLNQSPWDVLTLSEHNIYRLLQLSVKQLQAELQDVWQAIGAFGATEFSAEILATLVDRPVKEVVQRLRQLSLAGLVNPAAGGRYQLHPLMHRLAQEALDEDENTSQDLWPRVFSYWLTMLEEVTQPAEFVARYHVHILRALNRAHDLGFQEQVLALTLQLAPLWEQQGLYQIGYEYTARCLEKANSDLFLWHGRFCRHIGHYEEAAAAFRQGLTRSSADQRCSFLAECGITASCMGETEESKSWFRQALPLAEVQQASELLSVIYEELGIIETLYGEFEQSEAYLLAGLAHSEAGQLPLRKIHFFKSLGAVKILRHELDDGAEHLSQGLALAETHHYPIGLVTVHNNLAVLSHLQKRLVQAHKHLSTAQEIAQDMEAVSLLPLIEENLSRWTGEARLRLFV
ncbi:MAG: NB-ARC domain-containing protein [Ardenticatenaceae bacterium]|nr:NB-ARC domain-containing protein [Ardenticatenaceae bacterium]